MNPYENTAHLLRLLGLLFIIAVPINYLWELGQGFLFVGMTGWENIWWHCFVASLGDGIILWIIYGSAWLILGRSDWFMQRTPKTYLVMLSIGFVIAVVIEWYAVHVAGRWEYTEAMPTIPVIDVGVMPLLQMLVLPPLIFRILAARIGRSDQK